MLESDLNIIYLGYSGFPYGLAEFQRMLLISQAFLYVGSKVTIIGSAPFHYREIHPDIKRVGHFQKILYIYSSISPFRNPSFIKRNILKLTERIREFIVIKKLNRRRKIDAAVVTVQSFRHLLFYRLISRLLRFKIILNFVEYRSAISTWGDIKNKYNDILFDHFAVRVSDAIFVISEFLINKIKKIDPHKPFLKIPVLVDVDRFNVLVNSIEEKYFLFCGAAGYKQIIIFIIKSFELIADHDTFLYLIINGKNEQVDEIKNRITSSSKSNLIKFFSNISDKEISSLYKNSSGLLIPLSPSVQDEARFPHKFGEYLASGNPVITTNYGEVKYYFKDKVNALVADHYTEEEFAEKMNFVLSNPAECGIIGENGKKIASDIMDYKKYGDKVVSFVNDLKSGYHNKKFYYK